MARDGGGELRRAAVGQVVAGDGGEHGVAQAHLLDGLGHPLGLARIGGLGVAGVDQAEPAGPGAALAVDHERGGAVAPALGDVGAARLLAHRDELEVAHGPLDLEVLGPEVGLGPHPLGLALRDVDALRRRRPRPAGRAGGPRCPAGLVRATGSDARACDGTGSGHLAGAGAAGERGEVAVAVAPHHVVAVVAAGPHRAVARATTASTTSAIEASMPSARSDVTALSGMPHGTMWSNMRHVGVDVEAEAVEASCRG